MSAGGAAAFADTGSHSSKDSSRSSSSTGDGNKGSKDAKSDASDESNDKQDDAQSTQEQSLSTSLAGQQTGSETGGEQHGTGAGTTTTVTRTVTGQLGAHTAATETTSTTTTTTEGETSGTENEPTGGTDPSTEPGDDQRVQVSTYDLQPTVTEAPPTNTVSASNSDSPATGSDGSDPTATAPTPAPPDTTAQVGSTTVADPSPSGNDPDPAAPTPGAEQPVAAPGPDQPVAAPEPTAAPEVPVASTEVVEPPAETVTLLASTTDEANEPRRAAGRGPALSPLQILRLLAHTSGAPVPGTMAGSPTLLGGAVQNRSDAPVLMFSGSGAPTATADRPVATAEPEVTLFTGLQTFINDNAPIIVAVSLSAMFAAALPGLAGIFIPAVAGISIGYRQARAMRSLRASGIGHLAMTGPIGVVRSSTIVALRRAKTPQPPTSVDAEAQQVA